jgi:hypothetical protein
MRRCLRLSMRTISSPGGLSYMLPRLSTPDAESRPPPLPHCCAFPACNTCPLPGVFVMSSGFARSVRESLRLGRRTARRILLEPQRSSGDELSRSFNRVNHPIAELQSEASPVFPRCREQVFRHQYWGSTASLVHDAAGWEARLEPSPRLEMHPQTTYPYAILLRYFCDTSLAVRRL